MTMERRGFFRFLAGQGLRAADSFNEIEYYHGVKYAFRAGVKSQNGPVFLIFPHFSGRFSANGWGELELLVIPQEITDIPWAGLFSRQGIAPARVCALDTLPRRAPKQAAARLVWLPTPEALSAGEYPELPTLLVLDSAVVEPAQAAEITSKLPENSDIFVGAGLSWAPAGPLWRRVESFARGE